MCRCRTLYLAQEGGLIPKTWFWDTSFGFWSWPSFLLQSKSVHYNTVASTNVPKVTIKQPSSCQLLPISPDMPCKTFAHLFKLRPCKAVPCSMLSQAHRCSEIWKLQKCFRDKAASSWTKFSSVRQDHIKGGQVYHTISTRAMLHCHMTSLVTHDISRPTSDPHKPNVSLLTEGFPFQDDQCGATSFPNYKLTDTALVIANS